MPDISQHVSAKGESSLANITAFYNEKIGFLEERRTVDDIYFYFSKILSIIPHNSLTDRLMICELDL